MTTQPATQPKVSTMKGKAPFAYDTDQIQEFLARVFHKEPDLKSVCAYATPKKPGFPVTGDALLERLNKPSPAMACYFGTATMTPDGDRLLNRQANMVSMAVVVLDDIGTKIPRDSMPKALDPTYKIETSKGNEQWGLVLKEPITDVEEAKLLIKLVYSSGYTDGGGALCNKIVRLPAGINGKVNPAMMGDEGNKFPVKLLDMDGPRATPQTILDDLGLELSWEAMLKDPELVRRQMRAKQGAAAFNPNPLPGETNDGVSDVVLAWLYDNKRVLQDADEWITVPCPWAHEHTGGDGTAGYSPLGHGAEDYQRQYRGFHCFHEHCSTRHAKDFLQWVASAGGPPAPVHDRAYDLVSRLIFDISGDCFYDIKLDDYREQRGNGISKGMFPIMHPGKVELEVGSGKTFKQSNLGQWSDHPGRLIVQGVASVPGGGVIIGGKGKIQQLNIFSMPEYKRRPHNPEIVAPFLKFLDYLIPHDVENKYFKDWLACKAQNPIFRGNAIVMVADEQEGTGRGTLGKLIGRVWGANNVYNVPFDDLLESQFNPYMQAMFVTCDETLMSSSQRHKEAAYEKLKSLIEPSATAITVNEKHEKQFSVFGGPSFIFSSNHENALYVKGQARRFFVINNPRTPCFPNGLPDPTVFNEVYEYMDTKGWENEVHNWLLDRDVDEKAMLMPAPDTQGKETMRGASGSIAEKVLCAVVEAWSTHSGLLIPRHVKDIYTTLLLRVNSEAKVDASFAAVRKSCMHSIKQNDPQPRVIRLGTKTVSVSICKSATAGLIRSPHWDTNFCIERERLQDAWDKGGFLANIEAAAADTLELL
jgi:hypothetical protein